MHTPRFVFLLASAWLLVTACQPSEDGPTDAGADGADGGADASPCNDPPQDTPPPPTVDSRQTVTFHVSGNGLLVTGANGPCAPLSFSSGADTLTLVGASECGCECSPPIGPSVGQLVRLGTYDMVWDARALVSSYRALDCTRPGPWGPICRRTRLDGRQPVPAGRYTARFAIEDTLPEVCTSTGGTPETFSCRDPGIYRDFGGGQCRASRYVDVEFDLPESGDIEIDVVIPSPT